MVKRFIHDSRLPGWDVKFCASEDGPLEPRSGFALLRCMSQVLMWWTAPMMLNRARHLFIHQQTALINAIRAHLAEFGIVAPVGRNGVEQLLNVVADTSSDGARK